MAADKPKKRTEPPAVVEVDNPQTPPALPDDDLPDPESADAPLTVTSTILGDPPLGLREPWDYRRFIIVQRRLVREDLWEDVLRALDILFDDEARSRIEIAIIDKKIDVAGTFEVMNAALQARAARPTK